MTLKMENITDQYVDINKINKQKKILKITHNKIEERCISNSPVITTEEKLITTAEHNPIQILINSMLDNNMKVECISSLSRSLFEGILKLIEVDCSHKETTHGSVYETLTNEINLECLIELLIRWKGWERFDTIKYISYDALFFYLKCNLSKIKLQRDDIIHNVLDNMFNMENVIVASCSFKELQALFYHNPRNHAKFYTENILIHQLKESLPKYIIVWPYVSTRIDLPNFSMTHQNDHLDEFTVSNISYSTITANRNKRLYSKDLANINRYSNIKSVKKVLNHLTKAIMNNVSCGTTIEKKTELILALTMFENDITRGPNKIQWNRKYYRSPPTPYIRYLGLSDDGNICIPTKEQKNIKGSKLNVRLHQVRYPNVAFILENFNVPYKVKNMERQYLIDDEFLRGINTCITYNCLLCGDGLGSSSPSQMISQHFSKYHGLEPDWECSYCLKSYTNEYLLNNEWRHDCE